MPKKKKKTKKQIKEKTTKAKKVTKKIVRTGPIKAILSGETIYSKKKEALNLYSKSRFGEYKDKKIVYSLPEALYLVEKKKIEVYHKNKKFSIEKLSDKIKDIDKKILIKYLVFKDLRNKGYIIKTALKFGAEFRVYDKGVKPGKAHAKWILYPVRESDEMTWQEFAAKNRVAHSTKKNLLIGIVDEEGDVTYYEIKWIRP